MNRSEFKPGQRVKVYSRPYTAEREEGDATLVELLDVDSIDGGERWTVQFDVDDEGATVERTIVPEQYLQCDR